VPSLKLAASEFDAEGAGGAEDGDGGADADAEVAAGVAVTVTVGDDDPHPARNAPATTVLPVMAAIRRQENLDIGIDVPHSIFLDARYR
jgi:hypothetical protein